MDLLKSTTSPGPGAVHLLRDQSYRDCFPEDCHCVQMRWLRGAAIAIASLILVMNAKGMRAEDHASELTSAEGIVSGQIARPEPARKKVGMLTGVLLAADGATRALDAYSTVRMLRNRCNGDLSVPVCNEEMFLPNALTQSRARIYVYESSVWVAQVLAVRRLSRRHQRLARLIPTLDIATTLPFALNNLRLPVHVQPAPMHVEWRIGSPR